METCDELDNDCDGDIDEDVLLSFYPDADFDGYGDPTQEVLAARLLYHMFLITQTATIPLRA